MSQVESKSVSVEEFLSDQAQEATVLLATVEPTPDSKESVHVTPWRADTGCLCPLAITVPKSAIDHLVITDEQHTCCGKRQRVVEVHFKESHHPVADAISQQVHRMPVRKSVDAMDQRGAAAIGGPVGCIRDCANGRRLCVSACYHLPSGKIRDACFEGCASDFGQCVEGCGSD